MQMRSKPPHIAPPAHEASAQQLDTTLHGAPAKAPLIIRLPAERDDVAQITAALLSGRTVLVREETGDWRRIDPPVDPNGAPANLSGALMKIAETGCGANPPAARDPAFTAISEADWRALCEVAAHAKR
ncbi:MAG: hypothetical protein AAFX03_12910 [Pseudomonadota bacterium]